MMTKPWLHALCLHSYLLIPKLSNENKSRMRVEKREFAWEFSQLSSHDHANENKLSCMRVNESWEARVRLSVFSTLVPRSNENKSCMGVEKWAWEFHQLKREQELVVVWELRSESLHESLLNSIKASCMRVDESWEARVCMHACMHESFLNSFKREQELHESCWEARVCMRVCSTQSNENKSCMRVAWEASRVRMRVCSTQSNKNIQLLYDFRVWMAWSKHAGMLRELRKAREKFRFKKLSL